MTEKNNTPKIYGAIHKVLSHLTVAKNGTLPGNLGGKPYQTAEDISNEVKSQLVKNNVIVEAQEDVAQVESPDYGDKKMRFMITIQGTYRLVHIEDGSSITIKGVGQGMGTGVATAAAVAGTFALKSALLRTFLISDDSVEREGNTEQAAPKQSSAQQAAASASKPVAKAPAPKAADKEQEAAHARIRQLVTDGTYDAANVNALQTKLVKELGLPKGEVLVELEQRLAAGEVA